MQFDLQAAAVVGVLFVSTLVRSTFGFGDALLAMPLLVMIVGLRIATPLVALVASTIAFTILVRHWGEVHLASAWRLIVASLVGIPIGLYLLDRLPETGMKAILAAVVVCFSLYRLTGRTPFALKTERGAWPFGLAAGILGGAYNTNGPPVVIFGLLRRWPLAAFRATLQGYFFPTGLFILAGHGAAGFWTRPVGELFALSVPAVLLAIWLGARLNHAIPEGKFDRSVHVLLLAVGVLLFVQTVARIS